MTKICTEARTDCACYRMGLCDQSRDYSCALDLELSDSSKKEKACIAQVNYLAKILETQQKILKRLENQK